MKAVLLNPERLPAAWARMHALLGCRCGGAMDVCSVGIAGEGGGEGRPARAAKGDRAPQAPVLSRRADGDHTKEAARSRRAASGRGR